MIPVQTIDQYVCIWVTAPESRPSHIDPVNKMAHFIIEILYLLVHVKKKQPNLKSRVSPEGFIVHPFISQVVVLQIQLSKARKFIEGSFGNLL